MDTAVKNLKDFAASIYHCTENPSLKASKCSRNKSKTSKIKKQSPKALMTSLDNGDLKGGDYPWLKVFYGFLLSSLLCYSRFPVLSTVSKGQLGKPS